MNSETTPAALWYLLLPDAQAPEGPYSLLELKIKLNVPEADGMHVWKEGMTDWKLVGDVEELNGSSVQIPPQKEPAEDEEALKVVRKQSIHE
jgi:hypothetical protein